MRAKWPYLLLIAIFLVLIACETGKKKDRTIEGVWQSIGYGRVLNIASDQFEMYDITQMSCLPVSQGDLSKLESAVHLKNDTLNVALGFDTYAFERINELPVLCQQQLTDSILSDPVFNFEVFANTFKEHFAYFERNHIDWNTLYPSLRSKISAKTTTANLYLVMQAMIDSLKDNHGYVEPTDEVYELLEQKRDTKKTEGVKEYGDFEIAQLVTDHYLVENLTKDTWIVNWGKMEGNIGYIQLKAMFLHANLDLSDSLVQKNGLVETYYDELDKLSEKGKLEAELLGIRSTMDKVLADLWDTQCIILDVRFNGGGIDEVGMEILKRFNAERIQVASKKARLKMGHTKEIPIFLDPGHKPYTKPLYMLTSQQSASATDYLAMASLALDNVKRIGSHTQGALSDALEKQLPNGWYFSLSNEVYLDLQGICYESVGISVDHELHYPEDRQTFFRSVANDLETDRQNVLMAIEALRSKKMSD